MPTIGESLIKQLLSLPEDQALEIKAKSTKERNSIRVSIYNAKRLIDVEVSVAVKGETLKIYRGKRGEMDLEITPFSINESENESLSPFSPPSTDDLEKLAKDEAFKNFLEESEKVQNDPLLSEKEKEELISDLRLEVTKVYDQYNVLHRKKWLSEKEKSGKRIVLDDSDIPKSINNYPEPQDELKKEMSLLSQSNVKN